MEIICSDPDPMMSLITTADKRAYECINRAQ